MNSFLHMILFLTRIPIAIKIEYSEDSLKKGIKYLGLIGLLIGAILYATNTVLVSIGFDRAFSTVIVWIVYIFITGGLHIDGLADTFDGVFSNRDRKRVLEIMKDSQIGTFGVLGMVFVLLISIMSTYYIDSIYILIYPLVGRTLALIVSYTNSYARESGMGKYFVESTSGAVAILNTLFLILLTLFLGGVDGIIALVMAIVITALIVRRISRIIYGITGDVIGFSIEISQMIFLTSLYIVNTLKLGF